MHGGDDGEQPGGSADYRPLQRREIPPWLFQESTEGSKSMRKREEERC